MITSSLLNEYGESHKNHANIMVHEICVPMIFFCVTGMLYCITVGIVIWGGYELNIALLVSPFLLYFYIRLSPLIAIGMFLFLALCLALCSFMSYLGLPLLLICIVLFVLSWIAQIWGHKVEGNKPAFLKDLVFLLVGPSWIVRSLYRKMGIEI